jgi:hypothetical protein
MNNTKDTEPPPSTSLNGNNKKSELFLYIYNVVEDEWSFINSIADPHRRQHEFDMCENTSDCFFLANDTDPDFVYVSPRKISRDFESYSHQLMGNKTAEILTPKMRTHLICEDLYNDKKMFNRLIQKAQNYKKIVLVSYASSPQLYELQNRLREKGIIVYMPEAPEIDCAWTVNFFGSKSGIRQLAQQSRAEEPDFMMSDGLICVGRLDASKIAANKYLKQKGVVIKTNKGSGGNGVLILREHDLPNTYAECSQKIYDLLSDDYWEKFPIVIEDLINVNYAVGNGFPSIEFKVQKSGHIEMLYYCSMVVTKQGAFMGVDINEETMNDRITARIIDTGFYIAEQYSSAGYRGHFDIDMIAAKNNHIYVSESNTRNTGGTDSFKIGLKLLGKDFLTDFYMISRSHLKLHTKHVPSFAKVLNCLSSVLFSNISKEGVIINSENILKQKELIYIVVGRNKKRAYEIEARMQFLLSNLN